MKTTDAACVSLARDVKRVGGAAAARTCWLRTMWTPWGRMSCVNSPRKVRMSSMLAVYGSPLSLRQSLTPPGGGSIDTVGNTDTSGAGATGISGADE